MEIPAPESQAAAGEAEPDCRELRTDFGPWRVPAVLAGLYGVQVLLCLVPLAFRDATADLEWLFVFYYGVIIVQPLLLAVVAGLVTRAWIVGFPTGLLLVGLLAHFINFAMTRGTVRGEVAVPFLYCVTYCLLLVPIAATRWMGRWRIGLWPPQGEVSPHRQFRLRSLLFAVTAVAVFLAVGRATAMPMRWPPDSRGWEQLVAEGAVISGILAGCQLVMLPIVGAVLAARQRTRFLVAWLLITGPTAALFALVTGISRSRDIRFLVAIVLGATCSIIINSAILRWCGFRLLRESKPGETSQETVDAMVG